MATCWHQSVNKLFYLDNSWTRRFHLKVKMVITLQTGPSLTVWIVSLAFQGSWHELAKCNVIKKAKTVVWWCDVITMRHSCDIIIMR